VCGTSYFLISSNLALAYPGYISRDCGVVGVTGYHYWRKNGSNEQRTSFNTNCNIDHWAGGNWDTGQY